MVAVCLSCTTIELDTGYFRNLDAGTLPHSSSFKVVLHSACFVSSIVCLLTLGTHAQRGLRYLVCVFVCVCVSTLISAQRTSKRMVSNTDDFNVTSARNSLVPRPLPF